MVFKVPSNPNHSMILYSGAFIITHTTAHNLCTDISSSSPELSIPASAQLTALAVSTDTRREKQLQYTG